MDHAVSDQRQLIQRVGFPILQSKGWLKLLGVLSIVYGVFAALSIIGLLIAWLPIWMGVLLYQSANLIEQAHTSGDEAVLVASLGKLKMYFTIMGVLALIGLIVGAIALSLGLLGAVAGLMSL